jgi:capsular exopolysaccharide synthesis family protein
VLVTPIPNGATTVLGLGLLREATDPTQDVTTAARLVDSTDVAALVRGDLHLSESPQALLQQVSVEPVANTSIVSVTASTGSRERSQRLANAFATAAVQEHTAQLYAALDPAIQNLRVRVAGLAASGAPAGATQPLYQQLAAMEALRSAPDPTLRLETPATVPDGPSSPQKKLDIVGGLIAGLLLGIAGALGWDAIDPRKSRERGLVGTGLTVLARVPLLGRGGRGRRSFDESFRSLRTTLRFAAADDPIYTIAVTSASEKEGKTTTSFQLAMASLEAGQSVLLVEADSFRPGLRSLVDFEHSTSVLGLLDYLSGAVDLDDIIQSTSIPRLMLVPAGSQRPASITGLLETERGRSFIDDLSGLADLVILDCPPVGPRSDSILIASHADAVLMVVDLQRSNEREVQDTVRRLRRTGTRLLGIVLNRETSVGVANHYQDQNHKPPRLPLKLPTRR